MRIPLVASLALLTLAACGGSSDDDATGAATTEAPAADTTAGTTAGTGADPSAESDGAGSDDAGAATSGEARWSMGDQRYAPDAIGCVVTVQDDGSIVEVVAQGALGDGSNYASLRLVDSPPSLGEAILQIDFPVDGMRYEPTVEPSGGATGEVDGLFWEVADGTFVLLGSFPLEGTDVSIDLEVPCDVIDLAGDGGSGTESGGSTSADETAGGGTGARGTLIGPGVDVEVSGTCTYDVSDLASADIAFADVRGTDAAGTAWAVRFGLSGADTRNTQLNVNGSDLVVRWPDPGLLTQSSDDGAYELDPGAGRLTATAVADEGIFELDLACDAR